MKVNERVDLGLTKWYSGFIPTWCWYLFDCHSLTLALKGCGFVMPQPLSKTMVGVPDGLDGPPWNNIYIMPGIKLVTAEKLH